jgi:membrane protease YdiL (CAAX protease family)
MFDSVDLRLFCLLVAAGFAGFLSMLPLERNFAGLTTKRADSNTKKSRHILTQVPSFGIKLLVLFVAVWGGLLLSNHLGLVGAPLIDGFLNGTEAPNLWRTVAISTMIGVGVGAIISLSMLFATRESSLAFFNIPLWKRLLAGLLHGGIVEELLFRLFLLSFVAWLVSIAFAVQGKPLLSEAFWTANIVSALLFGLVHLPGCAALGALTKGSIALTMTLNGFGGLIYGYLFWQSGLEAAILAHMSTHLVLQPCAPCILRARTIA